MKKILLLSLLFIFPVFVRAEEIYFTNNNNVSLTENQLNYVINRTWDGFQYIMTQEDYDSLMCEDFADYPINIQELYDINQNSILPQSVSYSTASKKITLSSSCSSDICSISFVAKWLVNPNVRSYDVIGARFTNNVSLISTPTTSLSSSSGSIYSSEIVNYSNGFGVSIKLPTSASNIIITQNYIVSNGGKVFASYQHAKSNVSLNNSKNYSISSSGLGSVFLFSGTIGSKYDGMNGVNTTL